MEKPVKKRFGFTFIELLITISIIALLAAAGMISYAGAQKKARDAKRKADLETIRSALEMYRSDNDAYPADFSSLVPSYIQSIPAAPVNSSPSTYEDGYTKISNSEYEIHQTLEGDGSIYKVYNP